MIVKITVLSVCEDGDLATAQQHLHISQTTWAQTRLNSPPELEKIREMIDDVFALGKSREKGRE